LFLVSKLGPTEQGGDAALQAFERSLERLKTSYLDLYLIHWPGSSKLAHDSQQHSKRRRESWQTLESLVQSGRCRAIGVSNFTVAHLQELLSYAKVVPAVNQVEFHPALPQHELLQFCRSHNITLEAYSSLGRQALLTERSVLSVSEHLHRTPSQVLLRWALQQQVPVIPKSVHPERVKENSQLFDFELSPEQVNTINSALANRNERYCWDPTEIA
jgi:diketogulonate reductase-like aldo/keto reductase